MFPNPQPPLPANASGKGHLAAAGAFLIWGLVPLYWKELAQVSAFELILHRVVWSVALLWILIAARGNLRTFAAAFTTPRSILLNLLAGVLLSANWLIFIWAVNADRVIDTSLGYFLVPFISTGLGVFVLKERLSRRQGVAMTFALAGVVLEMIAIGSFPWIGLGLAGTFGLYGLMRKRSPLGSLTGLGVETTLLAPFAVGFLVLLHLDSGTAFAAVEAPGRLLIVASGLITAIPLLLFSTGARLIPLSSIGLMQFMTPTCTLLLGWLLYGEPFPPLRMATFALIWLGVVLYLLDLRRPAPGA